MKKHIIIAKLFEFGGSNSHLKTLIKYFGKENVVLILENKAQLAFLKNIADDNTLQVKIKSGLHHYAHLSYPSVLSNIKEFIYVLKSVLTIFFLSLKYRFADVTICVVEPEKYLYLFWVPFIDVNYILHTSPNKKYTVFTSYICNVSLGKRKKIITVSNSNKQLICENWDISNKKKPFIHVVYNCVTENEVSGPSHNIFENGQQTIVTLGHVINYKNPALWLEVAKQVVSVRKDVHFIWLGNGPLWNNFQLATQEIRQINFPGSVSNPKEYLKEAIIYYQPSLHETQGIAVAEAMCHHLPCVVSNVGGLPESVQHQYNGLLVDPMVASEHVAALLRLIDDQKLRRQYGLNAYNKYQQSFSFNVFKSKMDTIYIDKVI